MLMSRRTLFRRGAGVAAAASGVRSESHARPQTQDPFSGLKSMTGGVERLIADDYLARQGHLRRQMARRKIDALFVAGGPSLEYFGGLRWGVSERLFAMLIPARGDPAYVCPKFEEGRAQEQIRFGTDVRTWEEHESPYETLRQILKDRKIASGVVALEPAVREYVCDGLRKACTGTGFINGEEITAACRMVKSRKELAYIALACEITKRAFEAALGTVREGMTQSELGRAISAAHARLGAPGGAMVTFGPNAASPHGGLGDRKLAPGDVILIDGGCRVEGFQSDITRTAVFGRPTDKIRSVWDVVRKAQDAAIAVARPGAPCENVDAAARKVIVEAGYGPDYRYFTHRLGHGVGMEGHEHPYLVRGNRRPLEPGMVFSDEPGIYIPGEFGVRIEDLVCITEDGARFFGDTTSTLATY